MGTRLEGWQPPLGLSERDILELAPDAIVIVDSAGAIVFVNAQAERTFGYRCDELVGRSVEVLIPRRFQTIHADHRRAYATAPRSRPMGSGPELCGRRRDGTEFPAEVSLAPVSAASGRLVTAIVRDVSERKRAEEEREQLIARLETGQSWLCAVIEHAPVGIVLIEDADGHRVAANRRFEELIGRRVSPKAGLDQYLGQVKETSGAPCPPSRLPARRALRGERVVAEEKVLVRPDGREVPVVVSAGPIRDRLGAILGAVASYEDIAPLVELERLREEWASVIAHDLRQPATVISGFAGLLARQVDHGTTPSRAALDHILTSADQLRRMIADFLDVSRLEARRLSLDPQSIEPVELARAVVERVVEATAGHPVRLSVTGDIARIEVDPGRLEQVLSNLLTNAAKYGDPASEIHVAVEQGPAEIRFAVTNRGPGIPPDEMPKLFSRFYRSRSSRAGEAPGLGLGLYLAKGLIEAHGGRIWVESTPGELTTFTFTLPLRQVPTVMGRVLGV